MIELQLHLLRNHHFLLHPGRQPHDCNASRPLPEMNREIDAMETPKIGALEAEQRDGLQASIAPHHPTPPGSVSPTDLSHNTTFSPDEATPLKKKPALPRQKGPAYGGVRKRQAKAKKKVQFKQPLEEVRLIDSQDHPVAAAPVTTKAAVSKAVRGIQWTGFGSNHLPRHYPAIPAREAVEKAKEERVSRELNKTCVDRSFTILHILCQRLMKTAGTTQIMTLFNTSSISFTPQRGLSSRCLENCSVDGLLLPLPRALLIAL